MSELPELPEKNQSVGSFLRRIIWRREAGPLSAEAGVEMRELLEDADPVPPPPEEPLA
ncbi:MAG: hypothetical protein WD766_02060 [Gemmatimonadota bacterium]